MGRLVPGITIPGEYSGSRWGTRGQRQGRHGLGPNTIRLHLALLSHLFTVARISLGHGIFGKPGPAHPWAPTPSLRAGVTAPLRGDGKRGSWKPTALRARRQGSTRRPRYRGPDHLGHQDRHASREDRRHAVGICRSARPCVADPRNSERDAPAHPLSTAALAVLDGLARRPVRFWASPGRVYPSFSNNFHWCRFAFMRAQIFPCNSR